MPKGRMPLSPQQLSLFSPPLISTGDRRRLDEDSERLLHAYKEARDAEGSHPRSVSREVCQVRSLAREAGSPQDPASLAVLFSDPARVARALVEPTRPVALSTGRTRLVAAQRFLLFIASSLNRDARADQRVLEASLPHGRSTGWHALGTAVAGHPGRRRRRGPTLDGADLFRIVEHAAEGSCIARRARDRALVSLLCFSGLRPEEAVGLRWDDLEWMRADTGRYGLTVAVERRGSRLRLLVPGPAAAAIRALAEHTGEEMAALSGPLLQSRRRTACHLSYRSARAIVVGACRRAGYPAAEAVELRSAFASWLRAQGLSEHETGEVLGLARVRSVDCLLRRHAELAAQRTVRERIGR